jgi:SNF2 family DNA or RNA helicase
MGDGFLFDKLVVLNNVYNNTLIPGKNYPQASVIRTELYPHQATLVNGMHVYRDKMTRGFLLGNQAINGKIGIIGDPAGSGKTLSILAYLASQIAIFPRITCELTNNSSKYFFSHELYQLSDASSTNLVIVPHSLFSQWRHEIKQHTTMEYVPIETRRILKGDDLAKSIISSTFVLTTNKCYKYLQEYADQHGIQWNNIIIDEASSIYINSSDPPLKFQFLWFVTNNWLPLIFKNSSIIKSSLYYLKDRVNIHSDLEKWLVDNMYFNYEGNFVSSSFFKEYLPFFHQNRSSIVLRNLTDFIDTSIKLPKIIYETLNCRPNISLNSLMSFYLSRNMEPNIASSKVCGMFQALGVEFKLLDEYIVNQPQIKHNLIKRKAEEGECVICLEAVEYPTIVNCCNNIFCGKCLLRNMLVNHKCPTCREPLEISNLCCIKELTKDEIILSKNKTDVCIDILSSNVDGKFIVYSAFDNVYYQMFEELDRLGLKADRVENNLFSLLKVIKNFQEDKTNIIFISNIDLIRGLSLSSTSHLIFFHELSVYESKQILIHSAQRLGRKSPLKVIQLNSEIQV